MNNSLDDVSVYVLMWLVCVCVCTRSRCVCVCAPVAGVVHVNLVDQDSASISTDQTQWRTILAARVGRGGGWIVVTGVIGR